MSLPENQRKLEATERLAEVADDAGVSMIEPARRHGEQVLQPALRRR